MAKNPQQFAIAYAGLTQGCNTRHQGFEHPFLVKVPDGQNSPDQDFRPFAAAKYSTTPACCRGAEVLMNP